MHIFIDTGYAMTAMKHRFPNALVLGAMTIDESIFVKINLIFPIMHPFGLKMCL